MSDQLDLLLDSVREPEPFDEAFVQNVMTKVRTDEVRRVGRRGLRRPVVMGFVGAVVVTGGAVAALVGTNPTHETDTPATQRPIVAAPVTASDDPTTAPRVAADPQTQSPTAKTATPSGTGYSSDHSSFIVDAKTGLLLRTETYTNGFTVNKPQRVTLTLENTGPSPITFSASDGCALQVMAWGTDEEGVDPERLLTDPHGKFEWMCAGSDADPRAQTFGDTFILAAGERKVADAFITLPESGAWNVAGMCRCDYRQVKPTPVPKSDPLSELTRKALPSPLLPEQPDGKNLVTPAIGIRAS